MQMNITFRHLEPIDSLKTYAREKIDRVNKYLDKATEAHVVRSVEKHLHHADISVRSGSFIMRGRERSEDMYASIDLAVEKIEKQLKRYKEKLKHHHGRERVHHRQDLLATHSVIDMAEPEQRDDVTSRVVKTTEFEAYPMSLEEAVMQMDLMNNDFYVFTNSTTMEVNVLYRRADSMLGLIAAHNAKKPSPSA